MHYHLFVFLQSAWKILCCIFFHYSIFHILYNFSSKGRGWYTGVYLFSSTMLKGEICWLKCFYTNQRKLDLSRSFNKGVLINLNAEYTFRLWNTLPYHMKENKTFFPMIPNTFSINSNTLIWSWGISTFKILCFEYSIRKG